MQGRVERAERSPPGTRPGGWAGKVGGPDHEDLGQDQHIPSPPRFCDPEPALRQALADRSTEYGQISLPANYLAE
ncbi:hypothetical protein [Streptomyces sp. NPDC089915]|uniref:hypothetical protein n=1 Tax=Streptomyces sp. NPDC089915 TaxID=3155186 RepID=UPI00343F44C1